MEVSFRGVNTCNAGAAVQVLACGFLHAMNQALWPLGDGELSSASQIS